MNDRELIMSIINDNINEMNETIYCLYMTCNTSKKSMLLSRLRKNLSSLSKLVLGLQNSTGVSTESLQSDTSRVFSAGELSRYNGKDGKPAYVAVNGLVYDVTNNAGWAAATHFGLTAGRDLTSEFASCHPGQPILSRLKVVGKLVG